MQPKKTLVVAKREFLSKIKSKGFWISTVTLPFLMVAMIALPAIVASRAKASKTIVVVDETGLYGEKIVAALSDDSDLTSEVAEFSAMLERVSGDPEAQRADLDRQVLEEEIDAWLWISQEDLDNGEIEYHSESVASFITQSVLENRVTEVIRRARLSAAGIDPDQVAELIASVDLRTVRVTEEGAKEEGADSGFFLAYGLFLLLYVVLLVYGQQVLNGVLEEKSSRIVEVIVSTTRPFELMLGKLLGVCGSALAQLLIWLGTLAVLTAPGLVSSMAFAEGIDIPHLEPSLLVHFVLLFLIGFFVYSTFYAAIGAAFNSVQEAQQFASYAVIALVAPMFFFIVVINDPDSTLSVVSSLIPPFTPLLMLLRLAVKAPPLWQVLLGYVLSIGFAAFMVWLAGRIYRVGILMHGKKPTVQELWRWLRHA